MKTALSLNDIDNKLTIYSSIYKHVGGASKFIATSCSSFKQKQQAFNNPNCSKMINSNLMHKINIMNEILSSKKSANYKNVNNNFLFDPSINNVYCTHATFKYIFIFLTTIGLIISFSFMFFVSISYCSSFSSNLSLYLLLMGFSGLLRIILFYSCPFDYSKSIINKMYEHLVWRLCINRVKNSYYLSLQNANTTDNESNLLKRVSLFLYELCCCSCICFKRFSFNKENNNFHDKTTSNNATNNNESSLSINITNISTISTSSTSMIINEMDCFKLSKLISRQNNRKNKSIISTAPSINSSSFKKLWSSSSILTMKKSKSTSDLNTIAKRKKYLREMKLKHKLINKNNYNHHYGNRYFYGRYDNKYGTHKKLRYHHNRTYKPYRLIDSNSIRYCVFHLIQRCIDVFMISWFVAGNYWVFNSYENQYDFDLNSNNSVNIISNKNKFINRKRGTNNKLNTTNSFILNVKMNQTSNSTARLISIRLDLNSICYQTAFYQIISTYSIFFCFFLFIISYRIYSISIPEKYHHHRYRYDRKNTNLKKYYRKKNEDVKFLRHDNQTLNESKKIHKSLTCPQL